MAVGTVTIGVTPCCGVIERTYEAYPEVGTGRIIHLADLEDGRGQVQLAFAPTFEHLAKQIDQGICPDCGNRF